MKTFKGTLIFLILVLFFSCEEDEQFLSGLPFINCSECTTDEPLRANIEIKLENTFKYGTAINDIYIDIYEGNLEDNVLFKSLRTSNSKTSIALPVNKKYTFTARYYLNGNYYVAVNPVTPHVKYNSDNCDEPCYYTVPRSVNLRLKYTR